MNNLNLIKNSCLEKYKIKLDVNISKAFSGIKKKDISLEDFDYYFSSSAVYSSNIEGNKTDFNSFWKYRKFNIPTKSKDIKEIQDLVSAYEFARKHKLTSSNVLKVHEILAKTFLIKAVRGRFRDQKVGIYSGRKLEYLAVEPEYVKKETRLLFDDINSLLNQKLPITEAFYYASFIHLVFAKIHPFMDGNGRAARLLEKWFLASLLGENAWYIESEKNYFMSRQTYYKNIHIGVNYYELNYDRCLPFLLMLPDALKK